MRQLTALDEQFLALEGPRHYGHVGGVAVVDPSTAPGGKLELADLQYLIAEHLPLVPPFRWRLVEVQQMPDLWLLMDWLGEALDELRPKARAKGNGKVCGDRRASRPSSRASRPASRAKVATPKGGNSPAGSSAAKRDG